MLPNGVSCFLLLLKKTCHSGAGFLLHFHRYSTGIRRMINLQDNKVETGDMPGSGANRNSVIYRDEAEYSMPVKKKD